MEKVASDDTKMQARITSHMNKDHKLSVQAYAQHYGKMPKSLANTARLVAIDLTSMTLEIGSEGSQSQRLLIHFEPPLTSYSESRTRLIEMSDEACNALGYSHHVVNTFTPPTPRGWLIIVGVLLGLYAFSDPANFAPGSPFRTYGLLNIGVLADICAKFHRELWWLIIVIHLVELAIFTKTRFMVYHTTDPKVIFLWSLSVFFEGFGSFYRFDKLVHKQKQH